KPTDAREIEVGGAPEVHLHRWRARSPGGLIRSPGRRDLGNKQLHDRIRRSGGRVALFDQLGAVGVDLGSLHLENGRLGNPREGYARLVGRPPVSRGASHLLLRNELGGSKTDSPAPLARNRLLVPGRQIIDHQILVADETDVATERRESGVSLVAR